MWQLGAAVIAVQTVALLALGGYAWLALARFHHEDKLAELDRLALVLSDRYAAALADTAGLDALDALDAMADADGRRTGARITIILPDGRVVADSHHDPAGMDNHRFRPEVAPALLGDVGSSERFSHTVRLDMKYLARPLPFGDGPPAAFRIALPLTAVQAELNGLLGTLGLAGAASLLLTSAVVYLISRRLRDTLQVIASGASRFAAGDLGHRVDRPSTRELAGLAEALNAMAGQLAEQIDSLRVRRSEQDAILQSMADGVLALDGEQRILSLNRSAERILGVRQDDARGRLLQEVVRVPALHRFVEEAPGDPRGQRRELTTGPEDRTVIEVRREPLSGARNRPAGQLIMLTDVTQLRRLESMRSDFAANVSHELRTPITNIKGYVETLLEVDPGDADQTARFLDVIRKNVDRLVAIIDDILALTRLEQPQAREGLERAAIPAGPMLQSVVGQFEPASSAKRITVECQVPAGLEVSGHRQLLEQAVGNLLSNAINYSPADTRVRIVASDRDDGAVEIAVADEGPGIAAENLPRLFERFYRVDKARSRELGGTGLGLAIVKHVALVHRGRVEVESEPGRGSVFRLVLPRADGTKGRRDEGT